MDKNRLMAAANVVDAQATELPDLGIPVDPDVADFMGAFEETAVGLDDLDDPDGDAVEAGYGQ